MKRHTEDYMADKTCPICGRSMSQDGFCDDCMSKIDKIFPNGAWEYLEIEEIKKALENPEDFEAKRQQKENPTIVVQKDDIRSGTDRSVCAYCKKPIDKKDKLATDLKYGNRVCGECASKVRISRPVDYTWAFVIWESDDIDKNDSEDMPICIDPLKEVDQAGFISAVQEAETERANRRRKYGDNKAYFRVDNNERIIKNIGKGRRAITNEFAISGTVLLGEVDTKCSLCVKRREGNYSFAISRIEVPVSEYYKATEKTDTIHEGSYGVIILKEDASCIYPGDILSIN